VGKQQYSRVEDEALEAHRPGSSQYKRMNAAGSTSKTNAHPVFLKKEEEEEETMLIHLPTGRYRSLGSFLFYSLN
jgi:hypothetical protein